MRYTLQNGKIAVSVESRGAEPVGITVNGKEWIWQNPTGEWAGHSPVLFPVCGHFGVTKNGVSYPISAHGFAKKSEFALAAKSEDFLDLFITSNEQTKKVYPFDFTFHVIYRIDGSKMTVEYVVDNPEDTPLYFACGSHESFNLETNVDGYELRFEKTEKLLHYEHNDEGYLTGKTRDFGTSEIFPLPRDYLQDSRTVIFKDLASRKVRLCEKGGKAVAEICFEGFSNLLLWRGGDAPFICVEPWTNLPDFADTPDKEFSQKEGVIEVAPNSVKRMIHSVEYF